MAASGFSQRAAELDWEGPQVASKSTSGGRVLDVGRTTGSSLRDAFAVPSTPVADVAAVANAPVVVSTLSNGVVVSTRDAASPSARVNLRVRAGARQQEPHNAGVAHFVKHLAFERSLTKSPVRIVRELELGTGKFSVEVTRDHLVYSADLSRVHLGFLAENLLDVLLPRVREYIVRDLRPKVLAESLAAESDLAVRLHETLHAVAYGATGLGNSIYCHPSAVEAITPEIVQEFLAQRVLVPEAMQVLAYGADAAFVKQLEETLGKGLVRGSGSKAAAASTSSYQGGWSATHMPNQPAHVAIVYEAAGVGARGWAAQAVLAGVLGGASKCGVQYPGRGQASRLGQGVVNGAHAAVQGATAVHLTYEGSGLFGVAGVADAGAAGELTKALAAEMKSLGANAAKELARGKHAAMAAAAADTRCQHVEDLAFAAAGMASRLKAIEAVTAQDVEAAARELLAKPVTVVGLGDLRTFPSSL